MISGILNVYKEKGYTSFDVVAKLRGILKMKKIGHTGTLDPDAEGVLPVCLGKATKICDLLTDKDKEYEAVMLLGKVTDTQDMSGAVLREAEVITDEARVQETVMSFVGEYKQIPPMYSALKVEGKKLCDLARDGLTVERKARTVQILSIDILELNLPRVKMRIHCSKGTYIRTLCQDIGEILGCGACMESLLRTRAAGFEVKDALKLSEIETLVSDAAGNIMPGEWKREMFHFIDSVDSVFCKYEKAVVKNEFQRILYNGNRLEPAMFLSYRREWETDTIRIYDEEGRFIGVYEYSGERNDYKPVKVFMET